MARAEVVAVGLDIGSLSTEAVVLRGSHLLGFSLLPTGAKSKDAAERALSLALEEAHVGLDEVEAIVATGYGRISVPFSHKRYTEISCHGRGAWHLFPGTRTVIDIGGQDSKVIRLDDCGRVVDFVMNERCAAGTGRFLEVMAQALEVPLAELGALSLKSKRGAPISSTCTVFAESEVVSLIAEGCPKEDIIRGLHDAIARKVGGMVERLGLETPVVMTGGVAKNQGVVKALEKVLGTKLLVPPEPQIVGALGAALIARDEAALKT